MNLLDIRNRLLLSALTAFLLIVGMLYMTADDSGAIWPFNTPTSKFFLLCRNTADTAARAAELRDIGYSLKELLSEYDMPIWRRKDNAIQRAEYISATKLAYSHSKISPSVLHDMQADICEAKRANYIVQFSNN